MAEETFNGGYWNTVEIVSRSNPKSATGGDGPTQRCTQDPAHIVMAEMRIYHWTPAAFPANG
eukprot:3429221-Pyramimonas_sp.AAC.1